MSEENRCKVDRVAKIQQKLGILSQSKSQNISSEILNSVESRVLATEKRFTDELKNIEGIVREYREKIREVQEQTKEIEKRCIGSITYRQTAIRELQARVSQCMIAEKQERTRVEERLLFDFQEKIQKISYSLSRDIEKRKQLFNSLDDNFSSTLPSVNGEIMRQIQYIETRTEQLQKLASEQFSLLKSSLKSEEEKQESNNSKLMELMKNVIGQIKSMLSEEKEARQFNKEKMLTLFHEAKKNLIF